MQRNIQTTRNSYRKLTLESMEDRRLLAVASGDFNGDGINDLAYGKPTEHVAYSTEAGAVEIVYGASATGLSQSNKHVIDQSLPGVPGTVEVGDRFGASLAAGNFNGDEYDDLAVGAPGEDVGGLRDAGAVTILYGSPKGLVGDFGARAEMWHQNSAGIQGATEESDQFATSLAAGDMNRDGYDDLAVGVSFEAVGSKQRAGAVNVLYGSSAGLGSKGNQLWHQDSPGVGGAAERYELFGTSLASGDFDGDGYADLAVGVVGDNVGNAGSEGALNLFAGSADGLTPVKLWHQDTPGIKGTAEYRDAFGASLVAGDFNGDSFDDLVVGAPWEDVGDQRSAGAVNVIYGSRSGLTDKGNQLWDQDSDGIQGAAEANDTFGQYVTAGDLNGDGYDDLAVGSPGETVGSATSAGAVNAIYGSKKGLVSTANQLWHQDSSGIAGESEAWDRFGTALSIGDFNGDRRADLAVEAPTEDVESIESHGAINIVYSSTKGLSSRGNAMLYSDLYQIDLIFEDDRLSPLEQMDIYRAAQHWSRVIVGDLPGYNSGARQVDDLLITVSGKKIDGDGDEDGNTLAKAGPDAQRFDSRLPATGHMAFDIHDVGGIQADGRLEAVAFHEMGHVLGIGTIWEDLGLLKDAGKKDPRFTGKAATKEYQKLFGVKDKSVPVENTGGDGTRDGHWRESMFDTEVMTGWSDGPDDELSRVTVGALKDMGYGVDLGAADSYSKPGPPSSFLMDSTATSALVPVGIGLPQSSRQSITVDQSPVPGAAGAATVSQRATSAALLADGAVSAVGGLKAQSDIQARDHIFGSPELLDSLLADELTDEAVAALFGRA